MLPIQLFTVVITGLLLLNCHSQQKIKLPPFLVQHRQQRIAQFENDNRNLSAPGYIIFLGNSLTEGFPLEKFFPGKPVLNRGIVADHTGIEGIGILQRLESSVYQCRPSKIFLMIGVNDLADNIFTPAEIARGVKQIIMKIQHFNPQVTIYLQSALPTTGNYAHLNPLILHYNNLLKKIAAERKISFLDLFRHFLSPNQELNSTLTGDGVHLNNKGYQLWFKIISDFIE